MKYTLTDEQKRQLESRFTYHPPSGSSQWERYGLVRDWAYRYAELLMQCCPESRELSLALTHLEEVMYYANESISRNEKGEEK